MKEVPGQVTLTSLSVSEALENILSYFSALPAIEVSLMDALGTVLAEEVRSDMDNPPFDNSSMDGYAVRAQDTVGASDGSPVALRVTGHMPAGAFPQPGERVEPGTAYRIMTGAPVPPGADAVIRFEDTSEGRALDNARLLPQDARAQVSVVGEDVLLYRSVKPDDSIRRAGEDMREGDLVLSPGIIIRPAEIGVLASVGKARVMVHRRPRVAVLATGDELVELDQTPGPGQIRNTNNYAIAAQLQSWGAVPLNLGVARDSREHLEAKLHEALAMEPDLIISSAGVSVGDHDFVKDVLLSMGQAQMWRVRVRPGKPLLFGRLGQREVPLLGLPGNPVSSMVTMELFGRPAIMKMLGKSRLHRPIVTARALEALDYGSGREHYVRGVVSREGDEYVCRPTGGQGSNLLTSMSRANALLIIPESVSKVEPGDAVKALMLDWPEDVF
ncbi:MAG: molybdopterin molybdotransferase MoeA [Chloroflexota bacterium]|nr:molybdopterin molybdotransferase MoeA [Chloroflexota bacterium]MDQ5866189.1 molybdopterin molybdotransferase MoeA [Chloroflexota bacterium]